MAIEGWRTIPVDAIKAASSSAIAIGPFGSRMKAELYRSFGIPVIRGNNISKTRQFTGDFVFISEETALQLQSSIVYPGDLVFPHRGAIGEVGIVPKNGPDKFMLSTSLMKLTCDTKKIDPLFLFYFFRSSIGRQELLKNASTVGTPGIATPLSSLRSIVVPVPPLSEQHAIARILGSLDDKIELNRQMNETLEAMARAIFQSWFVDFDPVRAKADGRDTGLPPEIAGLFPDGFETVDGREVPMGWGVKKLSEICEKIFSGGTPRTENPEFWNGGIPWLSSGETRNHFIITTEKTITLSGVSNSSTRLVRAGATVIASAGQGHTRGQTSLLTIDSYINQSTVALTADLKIISDSYLFFELSHRYPELRQISDSHSSRGSLTTRLLANLDVIVPSPNLASKFDLIVDPIVKRISKNFNESRTLAQIRDSLLPKLMSGEINVNEKENEHRKNWK